MIYTDDFYKAFFKRCCPEPDRMCNVAPCPFFNGRHCTHCEHPRNIEFQTALTKHPEYITVA